MTNWKNTIRKILLPISLSFFILIAFVNYSMAAPLVMIKLFGFDLPGRYKVAGFDLNTSTKVGVGNSFGVELITSLSPESNVAWGLGIDVPIEHRNLKDISGEFYFVPLYGLFKFHFMSGKISPYVMGKIGFTYLDGNMDFKDTGISNADLDGGLYYGIGAGIVLNKFHELELSHSISHGEVALAGVDYDVKYSKLSLSYKFLFDY